jgi:hypothetical protein
MNFGFYWNSLHLLPHSLWPGKWNCCSKRFAHVLVIDIVIISQSLQSCEITAKPTTLIYLNAIFENSLLQDSPMHHYGLPYDRLLDMELTLLSQHDFHISGTLSHYICLELPHFLLRIVLYHTQFLGFPFQSIQSWYSTSLQNWGLGGLLSSFRCAVYFQFLSIFRSAISFLLCNIDFWRLNSKHDLSNLSSFVGKNHSHFSDNKHIK